jgi:hypothetical protein
MGKSSDNIGKILGLGVATINTLYSRAKTKGYQVVIIIPGEEWGMNLYDTDAEEE